jgi:RNA polymerase sigma-70 factor (ECF subfamily)
MNGSLQNLTEKDLLCQAQSGSMQAFEQIVFRYEKKLFYFLRMQIGNYDDAQDLTQRTFIKVYQALERFDTNRPFAPWLFTIARREAIQLFKRGPKEQTIDNIPEKIDYTTPASIIDKAEQSDNIWNLAGNALNKNQFTALWLRFKEDLSMDEIATTMEQSISNVKVLLFRAKKHLATILRSREEINNEKQQDQR